ncbi:hypothetical protein DOTSEDRAFT_76804 [Dothistroma septosporum NZE10]|uniref:Uncharacterized protein n=1 Tax=Dothistroma septosporum (strain NZE10 / CBS 128990) TaxID=675120 RepID=N1Q463_DOTSN|nr:hypothetical protein DOTSEDRAFT_76804 [Dothistroma septosporum NZE10]
MNYVGCAVGSPIFLCGRHSLDAARQKDERRFHYRDTLPRLASFYPFDLIQPRRSATMIVPNLTGIAKAVAGATFTYNTTDTAAASAPTIVTADYSTIPRRRRRWGDFHITSAFSRASGSPSRSLPAASAHVNDLAERQTCASGLTYYSCANGFKGCCAGNPCNSNTSCSLEGPETSAPSGATSSKTGTASVAATRSTTRISTMASGSNTATNSNTGTAVTTTPTSSYSATATPTVSATPEAQSGDSNIGAIAGGVVGGGVALALVLTLLALLIRHRNKVDARRAGEKPRKSNIAVEAPDGRHYGTQKISAHRRSSSTATLQGGFQYGHPKPSFARSADHFSELEGHSSKAPGLRAEGGPSMILAAILRQPQMLDSTAVGDRPSSKSSVFVEHMSEMEDTVIFQSTIPSSPAATTIASDNGLARVRSSSWGFDHIH